MHLDKKYCCVQDLLNKQTKTIIVNLIHIQKIIYLRNKRAKEVAGIANVELNANENEEELEEFETS